MTRGMLRQEDGFTLIELLMSTAIMMTVTAGVFTVMNPSGGIFQAQPEMADVQQRLRVGVDTLKHDLVMAGAGAYTGSQSGSLNGFFAPVQPKQDRIPGRLRRPAGNIQERRHHAVLCALHVGADDPLGLDAGHLGGVEGGQSAELPAQRSLRF